MAKAVRNVAIIVLILWIIEIIDFMIPFISLDALGIRPRSIPGLFGIIVAPFLHGNLYHLAANTAPFAVLSVIVIMTARNAYPSLFVVSALFAGLGSWLLGQRGSIHIGISGVIFGLLGFLLTRGLFTRNIPAIIVSCVVLLMYGGVLFGMIPSPGYISWECHLFGFLGGVVFAKLSSNAAGAYPVQ